MDSLSSQVLQVVARITKPRSAFGTADNVQVQRTLFG